jgi:hypothetical protein
MDEDELLPRQSLGFTGQRRKNTKTRDGICVREWRNRADYAAREQPLYIGKFEPLSAAGDGAVPRNN